MLDWIIALAILFFSLLLMYITPKIVEIITKESSLFITIIVSFIAFLGLFGSGILGFMLFLYIIFMGHEWVAGKLADLFAVSHYSMSDEQSAFESNLIEIKDLYSDEDNGFKRSQAVRMYEQYNTKIGKSGIQVVDRICRIEYISESSLVCLGLQTSINIEYQMLNYRAYDKFKFEPGDKIFFCGKLAKEHSFTYDGGINLPEFRIEDGFVYEGLGGCES
jgi:hypothetical protein